MYKKCWKTDFYQKNAQIVNIKKNVDDDLGWMLIFIIKVIVHLTHYEILIIKKLFNGFKNIKYLQQQLFILFRKPS
jgi:hypothetical protein